MRFCVLSFLLHIGEFDSSRKGHVIAAYVSLQNLLIVDKRWTLKNGLGYVFRNNDAIDFWDAYQSYVWDMVDEAGADGVIIKDGSSQYLPSVSDRKKKSINMQYRVVFYDFHGIIIVNRKIPEKENEKWQTSMAWA